MAMLNLDCRPQAVVDRSAFSSHSTGPVCKADLGSRRSNSATHYGEVTNNSIDEYLHAPSHSC